MVERVNRCLERASLRLMSYSEREEAFNQWWNDFASNEDLFSLSYCGYWLRGVAYNRKHDSWLLYESADDGPASNEDEIEEKWKQWNESPSGVFYLPDGWFHWIRDDALRAYKIGERLWGEGWLSDGRTDSRRYDIVIQMALLGEIKYG